MTFQVLDFRGGVGILKTKTTFHAHEAPRNQDQGLETTSLVFIHGKEYQSIRWTQQTTNSTSVDTTQCFLFDNVIDCSKTVITRMWANAQRDSRPAEYRWRPMFNAAKFGWCPLLDCRAVTLPRRETHWNLHGCLKLASRSQPLVGRSSLYCTTM